MASALPADWDLPCPGGSDNWKWPTGPDCAYFMESQLALMCCVSQSPVPKNRDFPGLQGRL